MGKPKLSKQLQTGKKAKRRSDGDNSSDDGGREGSESTDSSCEDVPSVSKKKARVKRGTTTDVDNVTSAAGDASTDPKPRLNTRRNHHLAGDADAAAAKAAAKRARADALLARLTVKLEKASDSKKRLMLQEKMLRVLPLCSPSMTELHPHPKQTGAVPSLSATLAAGGTAAGNSKHPSGFAFKDRSTPKAAVPVLLGPQEESRRKLRQQRFGDTRAVESDDQAASEALLASSGGLGTSEALEKEYLRLTSLPRAADVRPPAVLALALRLVKEKWLQRADYAAASEQLKAIRQDLTVQHVRDGLTVDVYETHGRLALEADDLAEFRRCHAVLRQLYAEGLPGNPAEFEAYGLLYTQATAAARNTLAMELSRVPLHLLDHPFVRHAREVCTAARSGNYARFVALYDGAPRMSPYIMDRLLERMRLLALQSTISAFKPLPVPLAYLAEQLGLETDIEAANFAEQHGASVDRGTGCLDTRASAAQPSGPMRPQ